MTFLLKYFCIPSRSRSVCVSLLLSVVANVSAWISCSVCCIKLVYLAEGCHDLCIKKCNSVFLRHFLTLLSRGADFMFTWEIMRPLCKGNELVQMRCWLQRDCLQLWQELCVCVLVTQPHDGASLLSGRL